MSQYISDIPLPEAFSRLESILEETQKTGLLGTEQIDLDENALGRILAQPIVAILSSPHYHGAAMDGFAVRSIDTHGALPNHPIVFEIISKDNISGGVEQATYTDTGDPLPIWADGIVPIEDIELLDEENHTINQRHLAKRIRIRTSITPWKHVRMVGEDIVATQLVLPAGSRLRPVDLGAIAAAGHDRILVARKPRVAILPTGSELVPIGSQVKPGDIIEFNSILLAAQVNEWGGISRRYPIIPDDFNQICQAVKTAALDNDLVLINAGSSAGSEDFTARVIENLGRIVVHGIAVRPGHPVIIGFIRIPKTTPTPIIGVPGYPISAAMTGIILIEPLLSRWQGVELNQPEVIKAKLIRKITSPAGDDDYLRVAIGRVGDNYLAVPLPRGAGMIKSLVQSDGIVVIPRGTQGLSAGENVNVRLLVNQSQLDKTVLTIGSHDLSLDLLAQFMRKIGRRLVSGNVGSLGGLIALQRGEAHFIGSHLLDPETGEYNQSYIMHYLHGIPVRLVHFVKRQQGLLVQKGNPKGIMGLMDLSRPDIQYVNRQRGSGTRVLLDYHLQRNGILPASILGYEQEVFTHLAVAVAISSDRADAGLGIAAAADALQLGFIPLFQEDYQLVVPLKTYDSDLLKPVWELIYSVEFQQSIANMSGYDCTNMGKIVSDFY